MRFTVFNADFVIVPSYVVLRFLYNIQPELLIFFPFFPGISVTRWSASSTPYESRAFSVTSHVYELPHHFCVHFIYRLSCRLSPLNIVKTFHEILSELSFCDRILFSDLFDPARVYFPIPFILCMYLVFWVYPDCNHQR